MKSFLLVISIGSIAGCGYFLAHSPTFKQMFEPEFVPPIAATLPQLPKKSGQNPDTKSQNVKSPELRTPIAPSAAMTASPLAVSLESPLPHPATSLQNVKSADSISPIAQNGAMTAAAAAVPSLHSVSRSADFSAPTAVPDTSAAVSYTSPDLAPAAHPVSYVTPPLGQVLGASTEYASPQNFATVQQLADLQNQIDALKNLPRSVFVPSFSGPAASTPVSTATFALSQKIDQLSGTSLSNITVNGVSGLTDADIPDGITASNYLPLAGGTLTGDLAMSGTLTAGSLTVAGSQYVSGFYDTSGTTGGYKVDGNLVLQASSTNKMTAGGIGALAGFFSTHSTDGPTAFGYQALNSLAIVHNSTVGDTAFGYQALKSANNGVVDNEGNTAMGYQALTSNTTAVYNTAVGYQALQNAVTNSENTAFGYRALRGTSGSFTGTGNNAFGYNALQSVTSGLHNSGLGDFALGQTSSGSDNVALGYNALHNLSASNYNIAIGSFALYAITSENISGEGDYGAGGYNIAVGKPEHGN